MFFALHVTVEDVSNTLRDKDVVRSAGKILRKVLTKVDFGLSDKFCDGNELKNRGKIL